VGEEIAISALDVLSDGTPVVATPDAAVRYAGGDAVAYAEPDDFPEVLARVLADPEPWARAGLERARRFSWAETARLTADVYREALS